MKKLTPKQVFIIRFIVWTIFACLVPCGFIMWRFDLFKTVSKVNIGGWGLIAIIIFFSFLISIGKYLKDGMPYSMTKQCLSGLIKVVFPLMAVMFCVYSIRNSIDIFLQAMTVVVISETIAIPINPMPKWVHDSKINEQNTILNSFFDKREKNKKTEETK